MTERGLLVVFSGPSGVGKDTILQRFLQGRDDCVLSVSATTRPPREGEEDGKAYHFLSREQFGELVSRGEMLEYAEYAGNYYGTPARMVEDQLDAGRNVILEIEVQGALQIRGKRPDAVFVFIMPPSMQVLEQRLQKRGTECAEVVQQRLLAARHEIASAGEYDYIIVNNELDESCRLLGAVIAAAGCSAGRVKHQLQEEFHNA